MNIQTDTIRQYISKVRGTIYSIYHYNTVTSSMKLFCRYFTEGLNKLTINTTTNHRRNYRQNNFIGNFLPTVLKRVIFFGAHFLFIKPSVFFLPIEMTLLTNGFRL
jgi:hypothetical protein